MKALVLDELNKPPVCSEAPLPEAVEGKVNVRIKAAAMNHRDVWISKGMYPGIRQGVILGSDGAGVLDGKDVIINPSLDWGDDPRVQQKSYHILGLPTNGTFAEYVSVDRNKVFAKPAHLNFIEAAALPLAGLTAYRALFSRCGLKSGEKVLISGVGGGVALMACLFAVAAGAEVWVTSGSAWKIKKAQDLGAKGGVSYKDEAWDKTLLKETGGFDVIIDSAAGDGFATLVKVAAPAGRICFYGGTRGKINGLNPQLMFWKQISVFGSTMGNDAEFESMLDFVSEHKIVPVVDSVYSPEAVNEAFERMSKGLQFGKIVFTF